MLLRRRSAILASQQRIYVNLFSSIVGFVVHALILAQSDDEVYSPSDIRRNLCYENISLITDATLAASWILSSRSAS